MEPLSVFGQVWGKVQPLLPKILNGVMAFLILYAIYWVSTKALLKLLHAAARTDAQRQSVKVFVSLWRYFFWFLILVLVLVSFSGSLAAMGLSAGILGMMLGWALQKPITGIAAWMMVLLKRPFKIGDRVIIGQWRGDIEDITLTHVVLQEVGGTTGGEEKSGRTILIPTSTLFDQTVVNYTHEDVFVLVDVVVSITYESDLDRAKEIIMECVEEVYKESLDRPPSRPVIRVAFQPSGLDLRVRFPAPAPERERFSSEVCERIFKRISAEPKVDFAYPHTQVILQGSETKGGAGGQQKGGPRKADSAHNKGTNSPSRSDACLKEGGG
ncbi:MAG TPA: mechanosensitive ion channel family protein [Armatimonadetes bacterium]|nr:mechanosensitive ion channel family protein [Armatimonadota bacterium]